MILVISGVPEVGEDTLTVHLLMKHFRSSMINPNSLSYSTTIMVTVVGEVIAFMIARGIAEAGGTDFTMAKVVIVVGVIATTMHAAIFAPGVSVSMMYGVILCILTDKSISKT